MLSSRNVGDDPFCECWKKKLRTPTPWNKLSPCKCGEDINLKEWSWDQASQPTSSSLVFSDDRHQVIFHPFYSSGTALVRGDMPLLPGRHYYWEIKMLTKLYGTDIMVGLGTPEVLQPNSQIFEFASLLGNTAESYGLSYTGGVYHDAVRSDGGGFGRGSIIGVRVDMWAGTLEFFVNRKPIGVMFNELKRHKVLFPMLSSTAAQSAMKLTYAASWEASLLVDAAKILASSIRSSMLEKNGEKNSSPCCVKLPAGLYEHLRRQFWITMPLENDLKPCVIASDDEDYRIANQVINALMPGQFVNEFPEDQSTPEFRLVVRNY